MSLIYSPGCALLIHKPEFAERVLSALKEEYPALGQHDICCKHDPQLPEGTTIINTCGGCDRRFLSLYPGITTTSLWEILAKSERFPFPNYGGIQMAVHDPCPYRSRSEVHRSVRVLLQKMNIVAVEPQYSAERSICCGDSFYPALPLDKVHEKMRERAQSMPCDEVCVYCVSCIKSMHIGGKKPRHLVDLLLGEPTEVGTVDTAEWHNELQDFIDQH